MRLYKTLSQSICHGGQLADAVKQTVRLLRNLREHALSAEMNSADRRLQKVPHNLLTEGEVQSGDVGAPYLKEEGWTIVEFNTDELRDEAALQVMLAEEDHIAQATRNTQAVKRLLGQQCRILLCLLNYAKGTHVITDLVTQLGGPARPEVKAAGAANDRTWHVAPIEHFPGHDAQ